MLFYLFCYIIFSLFYHFSVFDICFLSLATVSCLYLTLPNSSVANEICFEYLCQDYIAAMRKTELLSFMNGSLIEAGCDEAGRGPIAGPVFAAAVILPQDFRHPLLDDSKKMTASARETLEPVIQKEAVAFSAMSVNADEIDRINILNASIAAMQAAVMHLSPVPEYLLVDGNRFRTFSHIASIIGHDTSDSALSYIAGMKDRIREFDRIPFSCIVKGDGKYASIAAASVLAKTARDRYMREIAKDYPEYGWERNMGYPTLEHIEAVRKYGLTPHHRRSFHIKELEPALF